jgi:hypothetical protein
MPGTNEIYYLVQMAIFLVVLEYHSTLVFFVFFFPTLISFVICPFYD